jgi:hypothetical protein
MRSRPRSRSTWELRFGPAKAHALEHAQRARAPAALRGTLGLVLDSASVTIVGYGSWNSGSPQFRLVSLMQKAAVGGSGKRRRGWARRWEIICVAMLIVVSLPTAEPHAIMPCSGSSCAKSEVADALCARNLGGKPSSSLLRLAGGAPSSSTPKTVPSHSPSIKKNGGTLPPTH